MAGIDYTTRSVPVSDKALNGGLNSTSGPLGLQNNESSDLQNIEFDKFGSIKKRPGYTALNTASVNAGADIDGLFNFEVNAGATTTASLVAIAGDKAYRMDALDGTWDNITSATAITITAGNQVDSTVFQNKLFMTNGTDNPFNWDATNCSGITIGEVVDGLSLDSAEYIEVFNNYLFYGNVVISGTYHSSRIYWSDFKDPESWSATSFIDVAQNDGQVITGLKVLGDRLVVFKERSIYNVFFTGDADVPFVLPGGGKSNSPVGCVAPFSIQEVDNGLVFLSQDGFYFYDGFNSFKISDKVSATIDLMNILKLTNARSMVYKAKNQYWCSLTLSGETDNSRVFVWDYFNNAWSIYKGMAPNAMETVYVSNQEERPYWGDYGGYVYRSDTGTNDYPLNVSTLIDAYYWTNWKAYEDLVDKKGIAHLVFYHQIDSSDLTIGYSYDFDTSTQFSYSRALNTSTDVYDASNYGTAVYARSGGNVQRIDTTAGRGRVIRFKFSNNVASETFQVDGFGSMAHLETV